MAESRTRLITAPRSRLYPRAPASSQWQRSSRPSPDRAASARSPHAECQAPLHRRRERVSQDANLADPRCSAEGSDPTFLSALQRALHLQSPLHGTQLTGRESSVARTLPRVHKVAAAEVQRAEDAQPDEDPVAHRERHRAPSWMRPPVAPSEVVRTRPASRAHKARTRLGPLRTRPRRRRCCCRALPSATPPAISRGLPRSSRRLAG